LPLIPGVTDTPDNLGQIAEISLKAGVKEINLEPYNPLGEENILSLVFRQNLNSVHFIPQEILIK